jgi:hypothetical protein
MNRIFVSTVLWLVAAFSGQAKSAVIRITPLHSQADGFVFAVTNTPVSNGLSFFITITAIHGDHCRIRSVSSSVGQFKTHYEAARDPSQRGRG